MQYLGTFHQMQTIDGLIFFSTPLRNDDPQFAIFHALKPSRCFQKLPKPQLFQIPGSMASQSRWRGRDQAELVKIVGRGPSLEFPGKNGRMRRVVSVLRISEGRSVDICWHAFGIILLDFIGVWMRLLSTCYFHMCSVGICVCDSFTCRHLHSFAN